MHFSENYSELYNLNDATQQIISKILNIKNKPLSDLSANQSDIFFIENNLFNEYYFGLHQSSDYYVVELADRTTQKKNTFMIFLIISAISLFLALLILIPMLHNVRKTKENVLCLFLDIPERSVKYLYSKCENFVSNMQVSIFIK